MKICGNINIINKVMLKRLQKNVFTPKGCPLKKIKNKVRISGLNNWRQWIELTSITLIGQHPRTQQEKNTKDVAVWCRYENCGIIAHELKKDYIRIGMIIFNCYVSPNISNDEYERYIDEEMGHAHIG